MFGETFDEKVSESDAIAKNTNSIVIDVKEFRPVGGIVSGGLHGISTGKVYISVEVLVYRNGIKVSTNNNSVERTAEVNGTVSSLATEGVALATNRAISEVLGNIGTMLVSAPNLK